MFRRILTPNNLFKSSIVAASSSNRKIASLTTRLGIYKFGKSEESSFLQSTRLPRQMSSQNRTMKAIRVDQFGDESKLKLVDHPIPTPKDNEVLVKVDSIGVNPVEVMIRNGWFGDMIKTPYVPGTDVAGVVEEVGCKVKTFKKGDRVFAIKTDSGAYAEFCTAPESYVRHLCKRLSFSQGAAIGLPYTVAYKALLIRAKSKKGETIFIHGASGAVGQAATQLAKARGMCVIGTAGTKEGMDLVKCQGADFVFNHKEEGYMDKVKNAAGEKGINVILEMMANKNLVADLKVISSRGRIVVIGNQGPIPQFDASLTMGVEADIMGMVVQVSTHEEYMEMLNTINQGQSSWLTPHIAKEYSLDQAPQAHKDISGNAGSKGKLILKPKL